MAIACCELHGNSNLVFCVTVVKNFLRGTVLVFECALVGTIVFSDVDVFEQITFIMSSFSIGCFQMFHERFVRIQCRRWMHVKACAYLLVYQTVYLLSFILELANELGYNLNFRLCRD